MRDSGIHLALAGHCHRGFDLIERGGLACHATRALCEGPYCFDTIRTDGRSASVEHRLAPASSEPMAGYSDA